MNMRLGTGMLCSKEPLSLSFSGSGFLAVYQLGVSQCFVDFAPALLHGAPHILGASAGSLVAAAVACGSSLEGMRDEILQFARLTEGHALAPLVPPMDIFKWIEQVLRRMLPKNAHLLATGRLFVSMTRIPDGTNVTVSEFQSREDVVQALLCSCFLPLYCGLQPPSYKGVYYVDGGFTSMQSIPGSCRVLTVSPFAGEVDICPRELNNGGCRAVLSGLVFHLSLPNCTRATKALFPPAASVLSKVYENGYQDALFFLENSELIEFQSLNNSDLKASKKLFSGREMGSRDQLAEEEEEDNDWKNPRPSTEEGETLRNLGPVNYVPPFSLLLWIHGALLCNLLKNVGMIGHDGFYMHLISYLLLPCTLPIYISFVLSYRFLQFLRLLSEVTFWQDIKQVAFFIGNILVCSLRKNLESWSPPSLLLNPSLKVLAMYERPEDVKETGLLSSLWLHFSSHSDNLQMASAASELRLRVQLEVNTWSGSPVLE